MSGIKTHIHMRFSIIFASVVHYKPTLTFHISVQEFHEMSHGLLLWLENIDRRRNEVVPIAPGLERETLRAYHRTLTVCLMSVCVCVCCLSNPLCLFTHNLLIEFVWLC